MPSRRCLDPTNHAQIQSQKVFWNLRAASEQRLLSLQDIAHELFMALDLDGDAGVSWAATWLHGVFVMGDMGDMGC